MDINGTRFHQILGKADWSRCRNDDGNVVFSDQATLEPELFQYAVPPNALAADPVGARRGAARDRYGNWYWVDGSRAQLLVQSSGTGTVSPFWPAPPQEDDPPADAFTEADPVPAPTPCVFGGVAVTADHYLVVGTIDQPGLLVFDLHAGGPPRHLRWPQGVAFVPFDIAAMQDAVDGVSGPQGLVFVLDRKNRRYWVLDRHLRILQPPGAPPPPEAFAPASGEADDLRPAPASFPPGFDLEAAASPLAAVDPIAVEPLPDGSALILDRTSAGVRVQRYRFAEMLAASTPDLSAVLVKPQAPDKLFGADLAFIPGTTRDLDRLYIPSLEGAQAFAFAVDWGLRMEGSPPGPREVLSLSPARTTAGVPFVPMNLFGGRALVAAAGYAWYDVGDRGWVRLVEQKRPRFALQGSFQTPTFDGGDPGCVWHRLFLDGCVPPHCKVEVWSRATDEIADLDRAPWAPEPDPRQRATGSELPLVSDAAAVFELLFQHARGRYLQLKLRLSGDGRTSPHLRALRIWYPRFSYLDRYLPAVYRQDAQSASFLDRFLANVEGEFTGVEDKVAVAQALFDPRTAPADALEWLADWFGVALDPAWSERQQRLFLRHAIDFFQMRGTARGLRTALRLAMENCVDDSLFAPESVDAPQSIRILEWFRLRDTPAIALGDPSGLTGIRTVSRPPAWTPEQGGAVLLQRYRAAAQAANLTSPILSFPVFEPSDGTAPLWHQFLRDVLSLVTTASIADESAWHDFLAARYATADAFNQVWGESVTDVRAVPLPRSLPPDGLPLLDWYQFQLGSGRFTGQGTRWTPALGGAALGDRWTQALHAAGLVPASNAFPLSAPADAGLAAVWQSFASDALGFVPAAGSREQQAYRDFLARRYRRISALNAVYGTSFSGFDDSKLQLPTSLPRDGAPLVDWFQLFAFVLPTAARAHRFTVLLPVPSRDAFATTLHAQRRQLATRIVELEKPAHTRFDVKFYWAMFRIGEARAGIDTLLDQGSRAPQLMPPMVLDQGFLAESHLQGTPPERDTERAVLGQQPLASRRNEEKRS